jgi:hypothetical protein
MATTKKSSKPRTIKGQVVFTPEMVPNALEIPTAYSNNLQMQASGNDVWLLFNEVMPNGKEFSIKRRANVVMSVTQFFTILNILNAQAQLLHAQLNAAGEEQRKRLTETSNALVKH